MAPAANEILERVGHGAPVHGLDQPPLQLLVVVRRAASRAHAYRATIQKVNIYFSANLIH